MLEPHGNSVAASASSRADGSISGARVGGIAGLARPVGGAIGRYRWVICALLLFGTTKNYMDRQVLGVLKTTLQHDLGWSEIEYGNIVFAFQTFYAIGMLVVGRLVDRLGTRRAYSIAMLFWSLASMAHAFAHSLTSFIVARSALGFGESALFPASIKAVAELFPKKERALATGIFNAGTNIGAIITPLVVPFIVVRFGWRWAQWRTRRCSPAHGWFRQSLATRAFNSSIPRWIERWPRRWRHDARASLGINSSRS